MFATPALRHVDQQQADDNDIAYHLLGLDGFANPYTVKVAQELEKLLVCDDETIRLEIFEPLVLYYRRADDRDPDPSRNYLVDTDSVADVVDIR